MIRLRREEQVAAGSIIPGRPAPCNDLSRTVSAALLASRTIRQDAVIAREARYVRLWTRLARVGVGCDATALLRSARRGLPTTVRRCGSADTRCPVRPPEPFLYDQNDADRCHPPGGDPGGGAGRASPR